MEARPVNAFILTLLGGLFILLGTAIGVVFPPTYVYGYLTNPPAYYYPFLLTAVICGGGVLVSALLMYRQPTFHVAWGVIAIVLSVGSAVGAVTGYDALFGVVGLLLGIVGGALAAGFHTGPTPALSAFGPVRVCTGCGRYVPIVYPFCAYCGTPAVVTRPTPGPGAPPQGPPPL